MKVLCDLPATTLRRMIGDKRVSPVELLDSCIARIEATNPTLNAFVLLCLEEARRVATEKADQVARGDALPVLHGLPIGMKESYRGDGDDAGLSALEGPDRRKRRLYDRRHPAGRRRHRGQDERAGAAARHDEP